jgi:hypothetical protein
MMKDAKELIPWQVTDISLRPYDGYWSFNPSIHFDGEVWRCTLRCCDYAMPGGVTIRSKAARPTGQLTKNALVILDPTSWRAITIHKMLENDKHPRTSTPHVGYEDMRIFRTDKGGLQGIAASLHLRRDRDMRATEGAPQHQPPEQVLLSFDAEYNIVDARPIRGDAWSGLPQKNWVPFDHCEEPRFLYSIGKGTLFDAAGMMPEDAVARPSSAKQLAAAVALPQQTPAQSSQQSSSVPSQVAAPKPTHPQQRPVDRRVNIRGGDVQLVRGRRVALDASTSRPSAMAPRSATRSGNEATRLVGSGRTLVPKYDGLRGGTQLVRVGDDAWLGIGHEMKFINNKKYYWHTWYLVDARGKMTAASEPMKLAPNGIEFAAGMGIDGERVVVSFGVDDMECKLGETKLSAVIATLRPVARATAPATAAVGNR